VVIELGHWLDAADRVIDPPPHEDPTVSVIEREAPDPRIDRRQPPRERRVEIENDAEIGPKKILIATDRGSQSQTM
jgi:hypothetical protein